MKDQAKMLIELRPVQTMDLIRALKEGKNYTCIQRHAYVGIKAVENYDLSCTSCQNSIVDGARFSWCPDLVDVDGFCSEWRPQLWEK